MIGSTQWEQLLEHSDTLIAALEAKERKEGDAATPEDTEVSEEDTVQEDPESHPGPPPSVVLPSDRMPSALPLVAMFREDFERICHELEAGSLSGQDAAVALRAAKKRPDQDLSPPTTRGNACPKLPKEDELVRALRVLGVPPEMSIGREAPDLDDLQIHMDHLMANLRVLCGEDSATKVHTALTKSWPSASAEDSATIAEVVKLITKPNESSADTSISNDDSRQPEASERRCCSSQCVLQWCKCLVECLFCISLFRCCRRCCCRPRRHVPLQELLLHPKHDLRKCVVCADAWKGLPATAENVKFRRMPLMQVSRQMFTGSLLHDASTMAQTVATSMPGAFEPGMSFAAADSRALLAAPLLPAAGGTFGVSS